MDVWLWRRQGSISVVGFWSIPALKRGYLDENVPLTHRGREGLGASLMAGFKHSTCQMSPVAFICLCDTNANIYTEGNTLYETILMSDLMTCYYSSQEYLLIFKTVFHID